MKTDFRMALWALVAIPGIAFAAPSYEPVFPRGGLDANTQMWANTSTLNGKTLADWGSAIDANSSAAAAAQATANDAIPKGQKNALNGVQNSTNPTVWTGSVTAVGTPSGGEFVGADLPVNYSPTSGGGYGAVAQVDAAQAVQAVVLTSGVCPTSTTATLEINGTSYGTVDISGTTTRGTVLTVTPSGTVAASNIPDAPSDIALASGVSCTTQPQLITYWRPTHAAITSAGAGYTSLPSFTSDQSSVSTLAQSTLVATTLGNTTTAPVVQTQNGTPSGSATLNNNSEVIQPVNTTKATLSDTASIGYQDAIPLMLPYNGWVGDYSSHKPGARITMGGPMTNMADQEFMVGGHRLMDSVFSKFYALPYGVGDQGGCVHSILMTYAPGSGANCGAGGWDAVTEYELATNNPPWYMTGAEMPDENGTAHAVTFTVNGAYVRPALPATYQAYVKQGMHVLTNVVAGTTIYSGASIDGVQAHQNQDQRFYGNTLGSWSDGADDTGSYTYFSMQANWEPVSGDAVTPGHVPSIGTASGVGTDAADTVEYSEFTEPVLIFGTYIKHFTRNTSCEVVVKDGTDGEAVKRYGASRKCDEELDNWYHGPDYGATMHGLTIGSGFDNKVSNDSYGLGIASAWPVGIRDWLASDGYDIDGDAFVTGSRIGSPATIGSQKMMLQMFQEPTANIGYLEAVELWSRTDSISQENNSTINGPAAIGSDISYWFGPRQSPTKYNLDGTFESAIAFNPNWSKNGAAICGSQAAGYFGTSTEGTACLTVGTWGDVSTTGAITAGNGLTVTGGSQFTGNMAINGGKSITFHGATGASTSPYLYGSDTGVLTEAGTFVTNGVTSGSYTGTDLTGTGNAYACVNASGQLYRSATACN